MPAKSIERICPGCNQLKKYSRRKIYHDLNCYNSVRCRTLIQAPAKVLLQEMVRRASTRNIEQVAAQAFDAPELRDFDVAAQRFRDLIGQRKAVPTAPALDSGGDKISAVFADPHCPHQDDRFIAWAIADAVRRGATRAIVPGDLMDLFAFSRFAKYEHQPLERELAATKLFVQMLAENFAEVVIIPGNHDERARKFFARVVPPEFFFLVRWNLLELIAADLPNVKLPRFRVDEQEIPWLWVDGDLVLGHPETSSRVLFKPVDTFASWLNEWKSILGLGQMRVVGQGHTHFAGGPAIRHDGIAVFELGCVARLLDYVFDPKLRFHPQTNCYALFVQRDGRTDLNNSRLFFRN